MSRIILYATVPLPSIALHSSQNFAIKALSMLPLTFCIPFTLSYLSLITAKEELNASAAVIDTADPNLAVLEAMQAELKSMELTLKMTEKRLVESETLQESMQAKLNSFEHRLALTKGTGVF